MGLGYTESKWVTESMLVKASEQTPLKPIIVRLGHVCGGPSGYWDPVEWVPALVRSGQILGCLPRPEGVSAHAFSTSLLAESEATRM
jgi:thioester reductase-like protein